MIVPVVGAAPAGAAKFAGYPCRGELHSPPRHPAGMNDCPRGRGAHYEKAVQVVHDPFTHCDDAVQVVHGRFAHCDGAAQVLHGHFAHCDGTAQVLRSRFAHCEDAVQVLHGHFAHCDGAAQVLHGRFTHCGDAVQVLHSRFTHCDGPRNGAYAFAPLPGYTPFMYPAKFAGVRRRPGQIRRRPQTPRQTSLASVDARRRLHLRAFHSKYSQR